MSSRCLWQRNGTISRESVLSHCSPTCNLNLPRDSADHRRSRFGSTAPKGHRDRWNPLHRRLSRTASRAGPEGMPVGAPDVGRWSVPFPGAFGYIFAFRAWRPLIACFPKCSPKPPAGSPDPGRVRGEGLLSAFYPDGNGVCRPIRHFREHPGDVWLFGAKVETQGHDWFGCSGGGRRNLFDILC
jgi:hypothetical protein